MTKTTTTGASRAVSRRNRPRKALATNVDNEGSGGETEGGASDVEEALWDGLVQPNGSPIAVYLWEDIPRGARKVFQRQIEVCDSQFKLLFWLWLESQASMIHCAQELGGEEAMIQDEANVIVVPAHKFTAGLAARIKRRDQLLRHVDWLTKLAEDRCGGSNTDIYSRTPKRARLA